MAKSQLILKVLFYLEKSEGFVIFFNDLTGTSYTSYSMTRFACINTYSSCTLLSHTYYSIPNKKKTPWPTCSKCLRPSSSSASVAIGASWPIGGMMLFGKGSASGTATGTGTGTGLGCVVICWVGNTGMEETGKSKPLKQTTKTQHKSKQGY